MFHAVGYEEINGKYHYFAYTCRFFSERVEISESTYEDFRKVFRVSGTKNTYLTGIYLRSEA